MDPESRRDLSLLEAVAADQQITQRRLATQLGIALGLTNLYVKRLIRKGYIKCVTVPSNRLLYMITPRGLAQKTRLTYEFMESSVQLYRQMRAHLRGTIGGLSGEPHRRVAIYGTGEAAELAYLSLKEAGLEPVAIFESSSAAAAKASFLGYAVRDISDHSAVDYDALVVATMQRPERLMQELIQCGVSATKLVTLRPPVRGRNGKAAAAAARGA